MRVQERAALQPRPQAPATEGQFSIPTGYGTDRIVLMVKDPWWLFAYWEIQPSTERTARSQLLPHEVAGLQTILRVYDVTGIDCPVQPAPDQPQGQHGDDRGVGPGPAHAAFDMSLSGLARNWYLHVDAPNRSFLVDIGILAKNGRFIVLNRSNRVTTPRDGPSEVIDPNWATTDEQFWKLTGAVTMKRLSGHLGRGHPTVPQPLPLGGSSPAPFTASRQPTVRGFWCRVDTELIIHGATEPRATVQIQGQPVAVRPDGTFSIRLALPEGTQTIAVEVTSADGRQTRTTTPIITRATATTPALDSTSSPPALAGGQEGTIAS